MHRREVIVKPKKNKEKRRKVHRNFGNRLFLIVMQDYYIKFLHNCQIILTESRDMDGGKIAVR